MSEAAVLERFETLTRTVELLVQRVEDLENNRELEQAIGENGDEPLVAWEKAKAMLDLD
jgi:hypothetical protein